MNATRPMQRFTRHTEAPRRNGRHGASITRLLHLLTRLLRLLLRTGRALVRVWRAIQVLWLGIFFASRQAGVLAIEPAARRHIDTECRTADRLLLLHAAAR